MSLNSQFEKAVLYIKKALPVLEKKLGNDHPTTIKIRANFERVNKELGEISKIKKQM